MAQNILRRLKFDNDTINMVSRLVLYHDYGTDLDPSMKRIRRMVNKLGEDLFPAVFEVRYADIRAQSDYLRREKIERLENWKQLYARMLEEKQCVSLKTLAVSGTDLIAAGMKPGKELGGVLQNLLELVLEDPDCNTAEKLMAQARKLM